MFSWKKWVGGLLVGGGAVLHFLGFGPLGDLVATLGAGVAAITLHHVVASSGSSASSPSSSSSSAKPKATGS